MENYKINYKFDNTHPELQKKSSNPLILLNGFFNQDIDKYRIVNANIKINSFCYILKFNILKKLLDLGYIKNDECDMNCYISFHVSELDYPRLIYFRHDGEIIKKFKLEWSPGYFSFSFNDTLLFRILRTVSNYTKEIVSICNEEISNCIKSLQIS